MTTRPTLNPAELTAEQIAKMPKGYRLFHEGENPTDTKFNDHRAVYRFGAGWDYEVPGSFFFINGSDPSRTYATNVPYTGDTE